MSRTSNDGTDGRQRSRRKDEHLSAAASLPDGPGDSWLDCVQLVHNCLPEVDPETLDLRATVAGIELETPLIINAITGGSEAAGRVNAALAGAARELGLAIAVGSQRVALDDDQWIATFTVVRDVVKDLPVLANLGISSTVEDAQRAVDMVGACALQIHLNVMQEMAMVEGERSFVGYYRRLEEIVAGVQVPVIVKEVGSGIAGREALRLFELGVAAVDVGGRGGTNFLEIEWLRGDSSRLEALAGWGIPAAASIVECVHAGQQTGGAVIGSGGIRSGLDIARALALGARAAGIAGPLVKILARYDEQELIEYCRQLLLELRMVMVGVGCENVSDLHGCERVIMPPLRDWLTARIRED